MLQTITAKLDVQGHIHWQEKPKLTGECNVLVTVLDESVKFNAKTKEVVLSRKRYQDLLDIEKQVSQNTLLDNVTKEKTQRFDSASDLIKTSSSHKYKEIDDVFCKLYEPDRKPVSIEAMNDAIRDRMKDKFT